MFKYTILFVLVAAVILLGLTSPAFSFFDPRRDPVPDNLKVAHSSHCAGCHGFDKTGQSLVDEKGNDVNIHDDWQLSMMGLSAHDPFWRATIALETNLFPAAKEAIEDACLKCHAPLGSFQSHHAGLTYSFASMLQDSLGLDGVSCSSCHQQPSKDLGEGHSGNFIMDTNRVFFGPYPNPVQGPMQIYVGFDPIFGEHIYDSGICAGCHTLLTETLDEDGLPTGNYFVEQATYHEWLNSSYSVMGKECQDCHLPFIEDSVVIATDLLALKKRYPYGLHQFFGANTAMLSLMRENKEELELPSGSSDAAWEESIANNRISLKQAADLSVLSSFVLNDTLYLDINIRNKTGHKLPSGYPSRIAWIQLVLTDDFTDDTIYKNGLIDADGNIEGRDLPYELHHEVSRSEQDVQIYEMVMSDLYGNVTTRLNAAYQPFKDNRLLPLGFRKNHAVYDTVAIWGNANEDPEFDDESYKGIDKIQYRIPLNGNKGIADLQVRLNYHTFPARWMADLFHHDSIAYVGQFKSMYEGYEDFVEIIDELELEDIDLSITSTADHQSRKRIHIFPNPGKGNTISVRLPEVTGNLFYKLIDIHGRVLQEDSLDMMVNLPEALKQGVYYFIILNDERIIAIEPFSVL